MTLKCLYMKFEVAYITFEQVTDCRYFEHLKGNTISFIRREKGGFQIHYINEEIEPTWIGAKSHRIEWK